MSEVKPMNDEYLARLRVNLMTDEMGIDYEDTKALLARHDRYEPYYKAVRQAHNGYEAKGQGDNPCKEPATPFDAIRELNEEHDKMLDHQIDETLKMKAERDALQAETDKGWRPMDSAPKNGGEVLIAVESRAGINGRCLVGHWMPGGHCIEDHPPIQEGWYFWNGCAFDKAAKPIAWMSLPSVPELDAATSTA